jgi:peptidoglycan/xylan/chitin deacetylase (PgdA/CDA1 family)
MPPARALLYAATLAAFVMAALAVLAKPPPLAVAALATLAYVGWILAGVFVLRLRMFADAIVHGPSGARGFALTFDDGPDPVTTPRVLDALDAAGATATFFVIAKKAEAHPEVVREILRRGHAVGLHSYAHDRLFSLRSERRVRADLEKGIAALTGITGARPTLFRPPIGHTNPIIARVADALDLVVVGWSIGARDGIAGASAAAVAARVRGRLHDGAIVLLHDASERGTHTPVAADAIAEIVLAGREARMEPVALGPWVDASA